MVIKKLYLYQKLFYRNIQLDMITKFPTFNKNLKFCNINIYLTSNHIHQNSKLIFNMVNSSLLISNNIPVTLKNKKSISAFGIKKHNVKAALINLTTLDKYNFLIFFIFFILPKLKNIDSFSYNKSKNIYQFIVGLDSLKNFFITYNDINYSEELCINIEFHYKIKNFNNIKFLNVFKSMIFINIL